MKIAVCLVIFAALASGCVSSVPEANKINASMLNSTSQWFTIEAVYGNLVVLRSRGTDSILTRELKVADGPDEVLCNWTVSLAKPNEVFGCEMPKKCVTGRISVTGQGYYDTFTC